MLCCGTASLEPARGASRTFDSGQRLGARVRPRGIGSNMNFALTAQQQAIAKNVEHLCAGFDLDYWSGKDTEGGFPHDFYAAIAHAGYLGIAMPAEYGGAALGMTEAVLVVQAIAQSGAGLSGASAVHMNIFGLHPVVVFGTPEQKARWLPPVIRGEQKACFAVTEPNAGLNTLALQTRAVRD